MKKKVTFVVALVRYNVSIVLMKRESGANPEQTRYCKSYATFRQYFATVPFAEWEGCPE
jgi:hypothetical protein